MDGQHLVAKRLQVILNQPAQFLIVVDDEQTCPLRIVRVGHNSFMVNLFEPPYIVLTILFTLLTTFNARVYNVFTSSWSTRIETQEMTHPAQRLTRLER